MGELMGNGYDYEQIAPEKRKFFVPLCPSENYRIDTCFVNIYIFCIKIWRPSTLLLQLFELKLQAMTYLALLVRP